MTYVYLNKKDVLKDYKYAYRCQKCKRLYGTDKEDKSKTCPTCEGKRYY